MSNCVSSNVSPTTRWIARTAILLALTVAFQMAGLPQPVTGPVVNAMLFLAALVAGPWAGVTVGICTPVIAFWRGILPAFLGPLIPFIGLGNAIMVLVFILLRTRQLYVAIAAGAFAKYLVLSTAVRLLVTVPEPIALMMQTPQLLTALGGGIIALAVHHVIRNQFS